MFHSLVYAGYGFGIDGAGGFDDPPHFESPAGIRTKDVAGAGCCGNVVEHFGETFTIFEGLVGKPAVYCGNAP